MRELGSRHNDAEFYRELISTRNDETIANIAIVLIHQADYLLYRQLKAAERNLSRTAVSAKKCTVYGCPNARKSSANNPHDSMTGDRRNR